jgi:hypothetical protein
LQSVLFDRGCVLCDNSDRCVANTYDYSGAAFMGPGGTSDCYIKNAECAASPDTCQLSVRTDT